MSILSKQSIAASIADFSVKSFFFDLLDAATIAAAGSSQATGVLVTAATNLVTASDGTKAVVLPPARPGMSVRVVNTVATADLPVYPAVGDNINSLADDAAFTVPAGMDAVFDADVDTHWYVNAGLEGSTSGAAGAGITGGTGTVFKSSVSKTGGIITTKILIDLTGLGSSTTDLDVIGQGVSAAHLGRITAALNGTILSGTMTCLESPATGQTDIDLYSATVGTAVFDDGIAALTETALLTRGAAWAAGDIKPLTGWPPANDYLYLTNGAAATVGTYTAGKFLIELQGYDA